MKREELTQNMLKEYISYDKHSGMFIWKKIRKNSNRKIGDVVGRINKIGYIIIDFYRIKYKAHRLAWLYEYGEFPTKHIDHINGNRSDNRIDNLRDSSVSDNCKNRAMQYNNKSGCTGVNFQKQDNRWIAKIAVDRKVKYLGCFASYSDAVDARKNAEVLYGYSDRHGRKTWH